MNNQEMFDKVATHLLKQNAKSIDPTLSSSDDKQTCAYRGQNGLMCAIGCLIPDDRYKSSFEGQVVWDSVISDVLHDVYGNVNITLLEDLQQCHDFNDVSAWRDRLEFIAECFGLQKVVLETSPA